MQKQIAIMKVEATFSTRPEKKTSHEKMPHHIAQSESYKFGWFGVYVLFCFSSLSNFLALQDVNNRDPLALQLVSALSPYPPIQHPHP